MSFKDTEVGRIPVEWEIDELSNQVNITMGQSPKSEFYNSEGEGIPFMQGRTTFGDKYHEIGTWCTDPKRVVSEGDILMSVRAPVGDVNIATMDLCIGRGLSGLKMKNGNNEYLYYLLKNYIDVITNRETGTVFASINKKGLETLKLPFAPLKEQKAIANILSTLDEKIETNNKINKNLESVAQEVFKHWFVDFEFPDENGKPYKSSGGLMVESETGMIPEGWEVRQLKDLINVIDNRGKTPPREEVETPYPIIDVKSLSGVNRIIDYSNCMKFVNKETYDNWFRSGHPAQGDILLSTVGSLAEMKIFMGDVGCIAQNVVAMRTMNISNLYMYQYLNHIIDDLISYNIGSVQPSIKITHIIKHKVLCPNINIITKFHKISKDLTDSIYNNTLENENLINLRDTLLPRLMSGQLRIPLDK